MLAKIINGVVTEIIIGEAISGYVPCYDHTKIGDVVQSDGTPSPLPCPGDCCTFDNVNDCWVFDFDQIKAIQKAILAESCGTAITSTAFESNALGTTHSYDCRIVDQMNLKREYDISVADSSQRQIVCDDGTGYTSKMHSTPQILQVITDMSVHIEGLRADLQTKKAEVDAITPSNYDSDEECKTAIEGVSW